MNLYEIDEQLQTIVELAIDPETGEINDEAYAEMEALEIARDQKIENIACFIKNLKADVVGYKAEIQTLQKRAKGAEKKAEWLEAYLQSYLDGQKFSSSKCAISYRKSTSVECDDLYSVPDEFMRYRDPELNKTAVKEALKNGQEVKGCYLVEKVNMTIK